MDNKGKWMNKIEQFYDFFTLCKLVGEHFDKEWKDAQDWEREDKLAREKKAIMGFEEEVMFYKKRIEEVLDEYPNNKKVICPPWYSNLSEGIFAELYGLAGLDPWVYDRTEEYKNSSSAKLIGDRLYCLIDGKSQLQPQKISKVRREKLKRALLMSTPKERIEAGFHEIYLNNGIRITIYSGDRTKQGEDIMVFRKYVMRELTFEMMAELGTIPSDAVELFKVMVKIGFNVLFTGQVRSGKTTFMQVWQRYEDISMEGMAIATDPETPWHNIMPKAPIMQLIADDRDLDQLYKFLLRGDCDYILLEEMRDASSFRLAIDITSSGTMRSKATVHSGDPQDIPYKMASAIIAKYGGNFKGIISQIFRNFNYVMEFYQQPDSRDKKKLKSISEYRYDIKRDRVSIHCICRFEEESGRWLWKHDIGEDKRKMGKLWPEEFKKMEGMLKMLEDKNPIMENTVIYPRYYKSEGDNVDVH